MDKGIILFDIDRTIFDALSFRKILSENLAKRIGVSSDEIGRKLEEYIKSLRANRDFSPDKFVKFLCANYKNQSKSLLLDVFYGENSEHYYRDLMFPDFLDSLVKLKDNFRIGIYSEGEIRNQNYKYSAMGISKYMDEDLIFIVPNKTAPEVISLIPKRAFIVDDVEAICQLLNDHGFKAIWLNRKTKNKNPGFTTIHSLTELPGILL